MNEEYLWDKSGEPDPQIQELEQILAPLRYQPRPLVIPQRRNYFPLAIAASILLVLFAGVLWLRSRTEKFAPPQQQAKSVPSVPSVPSVLKETVIQNTDLPKKPLRKPNKQRVFNNRERQEALVAKQQLMLALRIASEKLKLAHRKTQGVRS